MKQKIYKGDKRQPLMDALLRRVLPLLLAAALLAISPPPVQAEEVKELPNNWQVWIDQEVYPLITKEQREAFLKLESDAQRQAFAERLWDLWGRQTGFGVDFRQMYHQRLQLCRNEFGNTTGLRARILLIQGPPDAVQESRCYQVFFPLEFWYWQQLPAMGQDVVVLFYQPNGVGPWRLWNSFEGRQSLYKPSAWTQRLLSSSPIDVPENQCFDSDTLMILLGRAEYWGPDQLDLLFERFIRPGDYRLRIKVEDVHSERAGLREVEFSAMPITPEENAKENETP